MKDSICQILYDLLEICLRLALVIIITAIFSLITGAVCLLITYICYVTKIIPIMFYGFALKSMFLAAFISLFSGFKTLVWDDLYISRKKY